jgi:beta-fructofuranosidase
MNKNLNKYISKVPFYKFSTDFKKQLQELETNPLLQRMKAVRKEQSNDPHRPSYHYVNPEGNLNDPNGLCYWKGLWHLFYQAYPPEDTRQHWGHAISDDLIHWEDLPYVIYPSPERCCYSGATLVEEDRVIAIYHGTEVGNMIAISTDPLLLNWEKLTNSPIIPSNNANKMIAYDQDKYNVFDPCIWKKDEYYYSLSGGVQTTGPDGKYVAADFLFRSKDLISWEFLHPFVEDDIFTLVGDDGACPYFWPIGEDKYILLFFSHMSGGQYIIGDYDKKRDKFLAKNHGLCNFGASTPSGVHAPSATPTENNGIALIFNMNAGKKTKGWDQIMTLPRYLELEGNDKLKLRPAGDVESLRTEQLELKNIQVFPNNELVVEEISSNCMEMKLNINLKNCSIFDINVFRSKDKREFTKVSIYKNMGFNYTFRRNLNIEDIKANIITPKTRDSIISIDSSFSSISGDVFPRPPENAPFELEDTENVEFRIFLDKSVLEIFVGESQCISVRVYPELSDSNGVSFFAHGNDAEIINLKKWEMKNIYDKNSFLSRYNI